MSRKKSRLKESAGAMNARYKFAELPPDPDGYFAQLSGRAKKLLAFYQPLGSFDREEAVGFMLLDLMHLSDREPQIGQIEDAYAWAFDMYHALVAESREIAEM